MNKKNFNSTNEVPAEEAIAQTPVKKRSASKIISRIINIFLIIMIILAAICTFISFVTTSGNGVPSIFGVQLLSIQTDSMYPELKSGDLAIDTSVKDPSELRPNDIITYWTVIDGERVLNTHRIQNIYDGGGYLIFETKGDNNPNVDPLTVHESEIVGKYHFRISGLGKAMDYLQTPKGFLLVVLLPVLLFFIFNLVQFFRALFEYQGVKNRIKFEQERGKTEDLITQQQQDLAQIEEERAKIEAELREKLRAEIMESMEKEKSVNESDQKTSDDSDAK